MAVLDLIHSGSHRNATGTITKLVTSIREGLARHAVYRQVLRELNTLNDRELADIGLHRTNIRSVAYDAAYGSK